VYFTNYDGSTDSPSVTYITLHYPDVVGKQSNSGGCRRSEVELK